MVERTQRHRRARHANHADSRGMGLGNRDPTEDRADRNLLPRDHVRIPLPPPPSPPSIAIPLFTR